MSNLKRNIFFTFITQFPTQFLGIISGIFITRMLGPEERGTYAIFLADVDLCVTIFGFSINNAIIYHFSNEKISKNKIYGISLLIIFVATIIFVLVSVMILFTCFDVYFFPKNNINALMILWFIITTFISLYNTVLNAIFQGYKQFNIVNKVALSNSFINIVIFGLLFVFHKISQITINAETVLIFSLFALLINTSLWYFYLRKNHNELKPDYKVSKRNEIVPILKYLGIVHLSNIINFLNYRFSLWIIAIYLNVIEVGYYALAVGISGMLNLVTTPISIVLMPYLVSENSEARKNIFMQYSRLNFSIILLAGVVGFLIAPFIIPFVYGKAFTPSIVIFQICLIGAVFSAQNRIWGVYNMSNNKQSINLYATIIGLASTIICSFMLIPSYGLIGATIGSIITYICMFVFLNIVFIIENNFIVGNIFIINKSDIKSIRILYENKKRDNKFL